MKIALRSMGGQGHVFNKKSKYLSINKCPGGKSHFIIGIEKLFKAKLIQNKCFWELNFIDVKQRRTTIRQHEKVN